MKKLLIGLLLLVGLGGPAHALSASDMDFINAQIQANAGSTGTYVLDTGVQALIARAWLVDHAEHSIEVQYFIWSTDNIGILAAEALLRAAERGVHVRVIVDDLLIDAPDISLLALAKHPNIDIRIYNPQHSVGTSWYKRLMNVITNFRGVNQRMHDKTFIVDGKLAITGGRNMAAEYFDYNHAFNFRDRDILLLGSVVSNMQGSFDNFWSSKLSVPVEKLYENKGLFKQSTTVSNSTLTQVYKDLHAYASSKGNFSPEVRATIEETPATFGEIAEDLVWGDVEFISDRPGKNSNRWDLEGGGRTSSALAQLISSSKQSVLIQSPYLVLSDEAMILFKQAIKRGVNIIISTNSLASTDNIFAFSGYRNQRKDLLEMGVKVYEYKPSPQIQKRLMTLSHFPKKHFPTFAIHAKTMVLDGGTVYIGTYNLDPRSQNLNTEIGVVVKNSKLASQVEHAIKTDIMSGNSWDASSEDPDRFVPFSKLLKVRLLQLLPIQPVL